MKHLFSTHIASLHGKIDLSIQIRYYLYYLCVILVIRFLTGYNSG